VQTTGLGQYYDFCFMQRTNRKPDGVALFTRRAPIPQPKPEATGSSKTAEGSSSSSKAHAPTEEPDSWIEWLGAPHGIVLRDQGNRVALLLHARHHFRQTSSAASGASAASAASVTAAASVSSASTATATAASTASSASTASAAPTASAGVWQSSELLLCTTHLTFPHHTFDIALRLQQIQRTTSVLDQYIVQHNLQG
jgi:hypothetical protein